MGDEDGAKQVLFTLESRRRAIERDKIQTRHPIRWLMDSGADFCSWGAIGYGVYPARAMIESTILAAVAWVIFRRANLLGAMIPTDEKAHETVKKKQTAAHYEPFKPLIYSIENCIPLVKFGQDDKWRPDPDFKPLHNKLPSSSPLSLDRIFRLSLLFCRNCLAISGVKLLWFRWLIIALGWLLATFFALGLSGLIKTS